MSTVYGEQGLYDMLAAGHGLVADPVAVFGLGADVFAEPPRWLAVPEEVHRRLAAKPADDGVNRTRWPGIVELARSCAEVSDDVTDSGAAPVEVIHRALTLGTALARRLPRPPVALLDAAAFPPATAELVETTLAQDPSPSTRDSQPPERLSARIDQSYLLGYWQDLLREQACRLADAIDDRFWTDPDALAGIVDDIRRVLAAYFVTAYALGAESAPPLPPRPAVGHLVGRRAGSSPRSREIGQRGPRPRR
jgi:hypothetical protein